MAKYASNRDMDKAVIRLASLGCRVERRAKHLMVFGPSGRGILTVASSSNSQSGIKMVKLFLKRIEAGTA
jgi:hypothetical protein